MTIDPASARNTAGCPTNHPSGDACQRHIPTILLECVNGGLMTDGCYEEDLEICILHLAQTSAVASIRYI
jgi:hypothetical protein